MARDPYGNHNHDHIWSNSTRWPFRHHQNANFILSVQNALTVDPWCDLLSSVSLTVDLAIDRLIHSAEVAHWTHTTEPMASHSHSGGPMAFRRNNFIVMTLSRPFRLSPHRASPGWPRIYLQTPRPPSWPRSTLGPGTKNLTMGSQMLCLLTGPGYSMPITFPRWRHQPEARQ